ncbi:Translation initiation factor 3 subunit J component [Tulasnella sp. JGI-2019a]|nr:Translation initiation factor 3 subunit J component [Tulasnella sp. JGI-2019a]KAG9003151.1 Translation initiation factor 3 subunit J component [Tulasnella sp. JGI-2019a]KAG9033984.1 Translation initiation factor 3 subunit J component [Tulasnella sp. JGI-2019a]
MSTVVRGTQPLSRANAPHHDSRSRATAAVSATNRPAISVAPSKIRPEDVQGGAKTPVKPRVIAPAKRKLTRAARKAARLAKAEATPDPGTKLIEGWGGQRVLYVELKNAKDSLRVNKRAAVAESAKLEPLMTADPKTKDEFVDLSKHITDTIFKRLENNPLYSTFLEHHIRELARPLRPAEVRKTATGLVTLANEKQKEVKDSRKTSTPTRRTVKPRKAERKVDMTIYDESLDDFEEDSDYSMVMNASSIED